jgi:hypothetical protein
MRPSRWAGDGSDGVEPCRTESVGADHREDQLARLAWRVRQGGDETGDGIRRGIAVDAQQNQSSHARGHGEDGAVACIPHQTGAEIVVRHHPLG